MTNIRQQDWCSAHSESERDRAYMSHTSYEDKSFEMAAINVGNDVAVSQASWRMLPLELRQMIIKEVLRPFSVESIIAIADTLPFHSRQGRVRIELTTKSLFAASLKSSTQDLSALARTNYDMAHHDLYLPLQHLVLTLQEQQSLIRSSPGLLRGPLLSLRQYSRCLMRFWCLGYVCKDMKKILLGLDKLTVRAWVIPRFYFSR